MKRPETPAARFRLKLLGASALALLLPACGEHPPKDDDDDDDDAKPTAAITLVAGDANVPGSNDGTGAAARFNSPHGIVIDANGNLYVADRGNATIRKITSAGVVTTYAGAAERREFFDATGGSARFQSPVALAINSGGVLYVTDERRIRSIDTSARVGTVATIPVGTGVVESSMGHVLPGAIAVDANGALYVTNGYGTRRLANGATNMIEGVDVMNDLMGKREFVPRGVAVDRNNIVYLWDLDRMISKWTPNGSFGQGSFAGLAGAAHSSGAANGTGTAARFERVVALTLDQEGNLYAADAVNNLVRKITQAGVVTTVAGTTRANVLTLGPLPGSLADIRGIAADGKGNLYATSGNAIIKIKLP
jgi:hypothetical protein